MKTCTEATTSTTCQTCTLRDSGFFCHLTPMAAKEFELIKSSSLYTAGSTLFLEKEPSQGIFVLCSGKVKLSVSSKGGKTLIVRLARPGELIGLSACMSGTAYEARAEAFYPSRVAFIRREDFLHFAGRFPEVYEAVARQLNAQYTHACEQLRTVGLSTSAQEKLARLFLHLFREENKSADGGHIKMALTHEQLAECVGSTRETITRTLSEFKHKHLVTIRGTTVTIPSRPALRAVCGE